jgi:integrase
MRDFREFEAANEDEFKHQRHHTSSIPESVTPIQNYPSKLRIYLTNASPFWQVKCFFKNKTYTKSLRTTNRSVAKNAAKEFFHHTVAEIYGSSLTELTPKRVNKELLFSDFVEPTLAVERARVSRGEFSKASLKTLENRLYKTIVPFFKDRSIKDVGYSDISKFVQLLSNEHQSNITIHQYLVCVRKVLNHAYETDVIQQIPKFPSIKMPSVSRGSFTLTEYKSLVRTAKNLIGTRSKKVTSNQRKRGKDSEPYMFVSDELQWLIRFMVNSFVRPSDIKNLQHQHVTVVRGKQTYLRLNLPESKKHDKPIVTLQSAVFVYEKLKSYQSARGKANPTDYLFFPELTDRKFVLIYFGWQFKYVQEQASIEANASNGKNRTLYSLRHTSITFRLLYGRSIDLLTLARNARTSVEMIEKFYSSNLSSEMNIDLLQGRR